MSRPAIIVLLIAAAAAAVAVAQPGQNGPDTRAAGSRDGATSVPPSVWRLQLPARPGDTTNETREVVTKVIDQGPGILHLVQADTYGLYRDTKITWSSAEARTPDANSEIALRNGKRVVVQNPTITVLPDNIGYTVKFSFFIPPASLPADFDRAANAAGASVFDYAARLISHAVSVGVAWAAEGDGVSGTFESTIEPSPVKVQKFDPQLEASRQEGLQRGAIIDKVDKLERELQAADNLISGDVCLDPAIENTRDWMKRMKEIQGRMSDLGEGRIPQKTLDASPEYRNLKAQHATLMAETKQISAAVEAVYVEAYRRRMGAGENGSVGVDAEMARMQIDKDKRALKDRLAVLRDCHNNPTAPTAIKAKTEDAAAHKRVADAIDAVDLQVDIDSGMREIAAIANSAAGLGLEGLGGILAGFAGEIEDVLLTRSMDEAVKSLEKCIVRCDPCSASPATTSAITASAPAPAPSGAQNFSPGPVSSPLAQPAPQVCKPFSTIEVWYHHASSITGCGDLGCSTLEEYLRFSGVGTLNYVPGSQVGGLVKGAGYEGTGTVDLSRFDHNEDWPSAICSAGTGLKTTVTGPGVMTIDARFGIEDIFDGRVARSLLKPESSEVQIVVEGNFAHHVRYERCDTSEYSDISVSGYQCTFEGVDLLRGGRFFTGPQNGPDGAVGWCEIYVH